MSNVLLVYEEIPERTVILNLSATDLEAAKIAISEIASLHGLYVNSSDMTDEQHAVHDRVAEAIFGKYEDGEHGPAIWGDKRIFQGDEPDLCKEGVPPMASGDFVVVHTGFML
jgi:hypothetical protein